MKLRSIPLLLAMCLLTGLILQSAPVKFDLPAQSANLALMAFARQAGGVEVLSPAKLRESVRVSALHICELNAERKRQQN